MAIRDTSRKPYIVDNDTNISIGLDLPIRKGDDKQGYFASTYTTIEAVKVNIRNLLNTHQGERLMQPTLGLSLRNLMFDQIDSETINAVSVEIADAFRFWLPFVEIRNLIIVTSEQDIEVATNTLKVRIDFNITQDPNTLDSVQVVIGESQDEDSTSNNSVGSGGY